jgi:hypothetical protein
MMKHLKEDPRLNEHHHRLSKMKNYTIRIQFCFEHTLVILIFDGAGGAPGKHVLNAAASLHGPRPHELTAAIRSL